MLKTHTHTYHPFNGLLSETIPGWAGTKNVKPIRILLKQETVSGSGISWAICKSAPFSRQHPPFSVYRPDALLAAQPTLLMFTIISKTRLDLYSNTAWVKKISNFSQRLRILTIISRAYCMFMSVQTYRIVLNYLDFNEVVHVNVYISLENAKNRYTLWWRGMVFSRPPSWLLTTDVFNGRYTWRHILHHCATFRKWRDGFGSSKM